MEKACSVWPELAEQVEGDFVNIDELNVHFCGYPAGYRIAWMIRVNNLARAVPYPRGLQGHHDGYTIEPADRVDERSEIGLEFFVRGHAIHIASRAIRPRELHQDVIRLHQQHFLHL